MSEGQQFPAGVPSEELLAIAQRLGFTDVRLFDRNHGESPLIHARWRGAPVALSQRTGLAGGIGVAFFRGEMPSVVDEDGEEWSESSWDEVIDTSWASPENLLLIAGAALEHLSNGRELLYADVPWKVEER